jgi:hypothetical protein
MDFFYMVALKTKNWGNSKDLASHVLLTVYGALPECILF